MAENQTTIKMNSDTGEALRGYENVSRIADELRRQVDKPFQNLGKLSDEVENAPNKVQKTMETILHMVEKYQQSLNEQKPLDPVRNMTEVLDLAGGIPLEYAAASDSFQSEPGKHVDVVRHQRQDVLEDPNNYSDLESGGIHSNSGWAAGAMVSKWVGSTTDYQNSLLDLIRTWDRVGQNLEALQLKVESGANTFIGTGKDARQLADDCAGLAATAKDYAELQDKANAVSGESARVHGEDPRQFIRSYNVVPEDAAVFMTAMNTMAESELHGGSGADYPALAMDGSRNPPAEGIGLSMLAQTVGIVGPLEVETSQEEGPFGNHNILMKSLEYNHAKLPVEHSGGTAEFPWRKSASRWEEILKPVPEEFKGELDVGLHQEQPLRSNSADPVSKMVGRPEQNTFSGIISFSEKALEAASNMAEAANAQWDDMIKDLLDLIHDPVGTLKSDFEAALDAAECIVDLVGIQPVYAGTAKPAGIGKGRKGKNAKTQGKHVGVSPEVRERMKAIIINEAKAQDVDITLALAIAEAESQFNPRTVSPKGAKGLFQLMDNTWPDLGVKDPFDPVQNARGGIKKIKKLQAKYGNDYDALRAYNRGEYGYDKYIKSGRSIPTSSENERYPYKVFKYQERYMNDSDLYNKYNAPRQSKSSGDQDGANIYRDRQGVRISDEELHREERWTPNSKPEVENPNVSQPQSYNGDINIYIGNARVASTKIPRIKTGSGNNAFIGLDAASFYA